MVLLSLVRANPRGSVGFQAEWRRFNVAVTRARDALVVFGNRPTLLNSARTTAAPATGVGGAGAVSGWVRWAEGAGLVLSARPGQDEWPVPWWLHRGAEGGAARCGAGAGAAKGANANLKAQLDINAKLLEAATAKYLEKKRAMLAAKRRQVAKKPAPPEKPADVSNGGASADDIDIDDEIPDLEPIPVASSRMGP